MLQIVLNFAVREISSVKKILCVFLFLLSLSLLPSCAAEDDGPTQNMDDALRISIWCQNDNGEASYERLEYKKKLYLCRKSQDIHLSKNITCVFDGMINISVSEEDMQIHVDDIDEAMNIIIPKRETNLDAFYGYSYAAPNKLVAGSDRAKSSPQERRNQVIIVCGVEK